MGNYLMHWRLATAIWGYTIALFPPGRNRNDEVELWSLWSSVQPYQPLCAWHIVLPFRQDLRRLPTTIKALSKESIMATGKFANASNRMLWIANLSANQTGFLSVPPIHKAPAIQVLSIELTDIMDRRFHSNIIAWLHAFTYKHRHTRTWT